MSLFIQGVAEAELEKDLERTFKLLFTASYEKVSNSVYIAAKKVANEK